MDTNIFDGVKPREWGTVLRNFVYNNFAGREITVYDADGTPETIRLARKNDRVTKNGANNSHKVIDKLARYRGDNIRALTTVQLDEALATAKKEATTDEHTHQWLDENGWDIRITYLMDKHGNIYQATLNIADGRQGKVLYDINKITRVDHGDVPSTVSGSGSHINIDSRRENISQTTDDVNTRFSLDDDVEEDGSLVAVHNATQEDLERALELGALPSPSIAIVQGGIFHRRLHTPIKTEPLSRG